MFANSFADQWMILLWGYVWRSSLLFAHLTGETLHTSIKWRLHYLVQNIVNRRQFSHYSISTDLSRIKFFSVFLNDINRHSFYSLLLIIDWSSNMVFLFLFVRVLLWHSTTVSLFSACIASITENGSILFDRLFFGVLHDISNIIKMKIIVHRLSSVPIIILLIFIVSVASFNKASFHSIVQIKMKIFATLQYMELLWNANHEHISVTF